MKTFQVQIRSLSGHVWRTVTVQAKSVLDVPALVGPVGSGTQHSIVEVLK